MLKECFPKVHRLIVDILWRLTQRVYLYTGLIWTVPPPIKPFVFQPQAQVHGKVSYSPHTPFPSTGSRTRGFKAKALRARCIVCDEPSGATAHENCTLVFFSFSSFFYFFFKAAPEADVLSSIQTQLQMKRRNIGGQSPVRWSKNEDLRGGKTTCGKKEIRRSRWEEQWELSWWENKHREDVMYRTHI